MHQVSSMQGLPLGAALEYIAALLPSHICAMLLPVSKPLLELTQLVLSLAVLCASSSALTNFFLHFGALC
jgi:hypothetical protein